MSSNNLIQQLQERGLIAQITDNDSLTFHLSQGQVSLYCGFDPTADSLHMGHLIPLLCLKRFQLAGHRPIALIGGATGLIGDPSFRSIERKLNPADIVHKWIENLKKQVSLFLDFDCGKNSAIIANNYEWFNNMDILTFLCNIGQHFSVNKMINKEAIKQRLDRNNIGLSFTEFSYNIMQGYDFAYLNKKYGVLLQIGGSDQWGNITSGIDLTRRLYQKNVFGLTLALITKADGSKFGKTDRGAVWLDPNKTSPYKFYQFWINTNDTDVYRFLKLFTFLNLAAINDLEQSDRKNNKKPCAQYLLAEEMTRMVHGELGLAAAKRITSSLFIGTIDNLTENDCMQLAQDGMPKVSIWHGANLKQALVAAELVPSLSQAHNMIASNAIAINGEKQVSTEYIFHDADKLYGRYTLLRCGKKNYCMLCW